MVDKHEKLEKIIAEKIKDADIRNRRKRDWIKLSADFLNSSINASLELSEQAIFIKLILMSEKFGPVPGLISDNDLRPLPHKYIAHIAFCNLELLESTLKKTIRDDSIYENSHGIFLIHFDDYQFTEYDRQKPYRQQKKLNHPIHKICPVCNYKGLTREEYCLSCEGKGQLTQLKKDYSGGKYGHLVKK